MNPKKRRKRKMARKLSENEYKKTFSYKFSSWFNGTREYFVGELEMKPQAEKKPRKPLATADPGRKAFDLRNNKGFKEFTKIYQVFSVVLCLFIVVMLLYGVSKLPTYGDADRPVNNEVAARYIEAGEQETGSVNIVTGMILTYRAFDTFGETNVLFIATVCVMIMLALDDKVLKKEEEHNDRIYEPKNDVILQTVAKILVPIIMVFGIYIIVNGQLSPGGGFSGGATLGAAFTLFVCAFGFKKTGRFLNEKVYSVAKVTALCAYGAIGTYYYTCGANGIDDHISLGTLGHILSGGIIFPIDVCVGIEVACTMYAFYALFRRGGL